MTKADDMNSNDNKQKLYNGIININDISETLLIPLYARAIESKSKNPIIFDRKAINITDNLNQFFIKSESELHKKLRKGKLRKKLPESLSLRTRKFDQYVLDFIKSKKNPIIVELGCGLSTRYDRIIKKNIRFYDLDLPDVIEIRKSFFQEKDNYRFISSSVLDFKWMDILPNNNCNFLFIAEGLFMYLYEEEVKKLVIQLQKKFPGCHLVCEVANMYIIKTLRKKIWRKKFQRDFNLKKNAIFNFGINDSTDFEKWNKGINFLDEWTYFDDEDNKLGWINLLGRIKKFRKTQWIVHYILN